jgi:hypothetical protein
LGQAAGCCRKLENLRGRSCPWIRHYEARNISSQNASKVTCLSLVPTSYYSLQVCISKSLIYSFGSSSFNTEVKAWG